MLSRLIPATVVAALMVSAQPTAGDEYDPALEFGLAKILAEEGAMLEAAMKFDRIVEAVPDEPYVRVEYAQILSRLGRYRAAFEQAEKAVELAPTSAVPLRVLGQVAWAMSAEDPTLAVRARQAFLSLLELEPYDIQATLSLGQLLLGAGRVDEALTLYRDFIRGVPAGAMLYARFGESLLRAEAYAAAEAFYAEVLAVDPGYLDGRLRLAQLQAERGASMAAVETLLAAPAEQLAESSLLAQLGSEQLRLGDSAGALETVDRLLVDQPEAAALKFQRALVLHQLERYDEAEATLRALIDQAPAELDPTAALAALLEERGRPEEAAELLARFSARALDDSNEELARQVALERVLVLARAGDWEEVAGATRELLDSTDSPTAGTLLLHADALLRLERLDDALDFLGSIDPASAPPQLLARHAEVLQRSDRAGEAAARLELLIERDTFDALIAAAETYQRTGDFERAVPVLERAIDKQPGTVDAMFWLGAAYERTQRREQAISAFEKTLAIDPDFAPALNYLGYMWAERGENLEEALRLVERAVELDPENGAYVDSLGWAQYQLGRYAEAEQHLERAAELIPDDGTILEHLGDVYVALGDTQKAIDSYRRALEVAGANAETVRRKLSELERDS